MNIYALTTGIILTILIIFRFRATRLEKTPWAYPLLLASFPVYYFAFAIYSKDLNVLFIEVLTGSVFFCIAYAAFQSKQTQLYLAVAIGCFLHAIYDYYHDALFINDGTPGWWAEFCGTIDLLLGIYLVLLMVSQHNKLLERGFEIAKSRV